LASSRTFASSACGSRDSLKVSSVFPGGNRDARSTLEKTGRNSCLTPARIVDVDQPACLCYFFGQFARSRGARTLSALPRHVDAFVADWVRQRCSPHRKEQRNPGREVGGPIEQMLRVVLPGSVPDRLSRCKAEPFRRQAPGFFAYLRDERGLREASVHHYIFYLRVFESYLERTKLRRLRDLSPALLSAFVAERAITLGKCGVRDACGTLRVFLRYLHRERHVSRDLSAAVERPRSYRFSNIPRAVTWDEARRVLKSVDRRSPTGRKDYAMLLLLITYVLPRSVDAGRSRRLDDAHHGGESSRPRMKMAIVHGGAWASKTQWPSRVGRRRSTA